MAGSVFGALQGALLVKHQPRCVSAQGRHRHSQMRNCRAPMTRGHPKIARSPSYSLPEDHADDTVDQIGAEDLARVGGKGANLGALARAGCTVPPGYCVTSARVPAILEALRCPTPSRASRGWTRWTAQDVEAARAAAEPSRARTRRAADAARGRRRPSASSARGSGSERRWRCARARPRRTCRAPASPASRTPTSTSVGEARCSTRCAGAGSRCSPIARCCTGRATASAIGRSRLAVVVQRLVDPEVSGILFTADPVSGHRRIASIDAGSAWARRW